MISLPFPLVISYRNRGRTAQWDGAFGKCGRNGVGMCCGPWPRHSIIWYVYLCLAEIYGTCGSICHTLSVWVDSWRVLFLKFKHLELHWFSKNCQFPEHLFVFWSLILKSFFLFVLNVFFFWRGGEGFKHFVMLVFLFFLGGGGGVGNYGKSSIHVYESNPCLPWTWFPLFKTTVFGPKWIWFVFWQT